jgi:Leucine-rich repeat (LRR) protein
MPSLEILDISRNIITAFPSSPGTLIQLRVLHVGRNEIKALPTYFPSFTELSLLMINHNPIEWPAPHLSIVSKYDEEMESLKSIKRVQDWMRNHPPTGPWEDDSDDSH